MQAARSRCCFAPSPSAQRPLVKVRRRFKSKTSPSSSSPPLNRIPQKMKGPRDVRFRPPQQILLLFYIEPECPRTSPGWSRALHADGARKDLLVRFVAWSFQLSPGKGVADRRCAAKNVRTHAVSGSLFISLIGVVPITT